MTSLPMGGAVLDFLATAGVERQVLAEEDAGTEVSEWELRERWEREGERRAEAEELQLFPPTPPSRHPQMRIRGRDTT